MKNFKKGDRVIMSVKGVSHIYGLDDAERQAKYGMRVGTVAHTPRQDKIVSVVWDGLKSSSVASYHQSFITFAEDN